MGGHTGIPGCGLRMVQVEHICQITGLIDSRAYGAQNAPG